MKNLSLQNKIKLGFGVIIAILLFEVFPIFVNMFKDEHVFNISDIVVIIGLFASFAIAFFTIKTVNTVNDELAGTEIVTTALGVANSNVMIADADNNITYLNKAVTDMFVDAESDIQKDLPNFNVKELVGTNIDVFHKNPAHQRNMLASLSGTYEASINVGGHTFDLIANPINDARGKRLGTVVEWQDVTLKNIEEARSTRIQTSLDNVSANVTLADENNVIIYMNAAVTKMLSAAQDSIRKDLPNFDVNSLVGVNIDDFHKNPEHQRGMLKNLTGTFKTSINIGNNKFNLVANPVFSAGGERLGTVVEWQDITEELVIQEEVNNVVNATSRGDFTQRLTTEGKEGFMLNLAEGINQICEISNAGLSETVKILTSLSEGQLVDKMEGNYNGLFDDIKQSLNATITQLNSMVGQIKNSANTVNSASNEISSGSADLSQRTEQQASTLEETAASMEELTGTVRQNSDNANKASQLSGDASNVATKGGAVVENAVEAMEKIEDSSKKISDIIGVIDEIAFQTNLLALNAAVEAARAGDAGKGFAVVASEVRTLAGRSAAASKDIKTLISASVEQVSAGSDLVNEAGETLKEIVGSVKEVAVLISEIADASTEQTSAIEEINTAIAEMDEGTQQNAALVEENTAAAQSLVEQSEDLEELVNFFTLDNEKKSSFGGGNRRSAAAIESPKKRGSKVVEIASASSSTGCVSKAAAKSVSSKGDGWEEF